MEYCRTHDLFNCWFAHDPIRPPQQRDLVTYFPMHAGANRRTDEDNQSVLVTDEQLR